MDQLSRFASWIGGAERDATSEAELATLSEQFELPDNEEEQEAHVSRLLQHFSILLEYERLQDLLPAGMYIMPSFQAVTTWDGALFARQGLYRGGVFRFVVELPEDYPDSPPELKFKSEMFHPMVEPGTGRVDIGAIFPEWRAGRDYASFVLPHLHRALLRREYIASSTRAPFNVEARDLFLSDPGAFAERAAEVASLSLKNVHKTVPGSSLQFPKGPEAEQEKILEALRASDTSYALEDRKAMFIDWFCNHYQNAYSAHVEIDAGPADTVLFSKSGETTPARNSEVEQSPEDSPAEESADEADDKAIAAPVEELEVKTSGVEMDF